MKEKLMLAVAGPINAFLSWKFFHPPARLTYSIYLLHMLFIRITTERSIRVPYDSDFEKASKAANFQSQDILYSCLLRTKFRGAVPECYSSLKVQKPNKS
jgi:hypothetical protein